jgi:hypothetical protein
MVSLNPFGLEEWKRMEDGMEGRFLAPTPKVGARESGWTWMGWGGRGKKEMVGE